MLNAATECASRLMVLAATGQKRRGQESLVLAGLDTLKLSGTIKNIVTIAYTIFQKWSLKSPTILAILSHKIGLLWVEETRLDIR